MTNYRLFLLSFLTVSWVFLSGLNMTDDYDMSTMETQKTEAELKSIETGNNARKLLEIEQVNAKSQVKSVKKIPQETKQTSIKATDAGVGDEKNTTERNELETPLDLSVPYEDSENTDLKIEQKSAAQSRVTNIFATETKKKARPLELDGDFLMSPEPEAEKLKSVDGAGIVIKLKR